MKFRFVQYCAIAAAIAACDPLPPENDETTLGLPPATSSVVAIHVSENTRAQWTYDVWKHEHTHRFLEEAFQSDGTQYVLVSDAMIAGGALLDVAGNPYYPILISLAQEAVSDVVVNAVRSYAAAGGFVYLGSAAFTKYENGAPRWAATPGRQALALGPELGLSSGYWRLMYAAARDSSDPIVDELPMSTPLFWWMPWRWDLHHFGPTFGRYNLLWQGPHWVWSASSLGAQPASALMTIVEPRGFYTEAHASTWSTSHDLAIADVDGDRRVDFVGRAGTDIQVGLSNGQRLRRSTSWGSLPSNYEYQLADVNGDGRADLVGRVVGSSIVYASLSLGNQFAAPAWWSSWNPAYDYRFADVNGDGRADMVGRSGIDVQVGLSNGSSFLPSTRWTTWRTAFDYQLADVDGDGRADIIGRSGNDLQVGLSNGSTFSSSTQWTQWNPAYDYRLADVSGDGRADLIGRSGSDLQVSLSSGTNFPASTDWGDNPLSSLFTGDLNGDGKADLFARQDYRVEVLLSSGNQTEPTARTDIKLAVKNYGHGTFYYNAEMQPLVGFGAGIGASARVIREYKTVRDAVDRAFAAHTQVNIRLAPWPYPFNSALIYRHDHTVNLDLVAVEASYGVRGEYYIWPDRPCNDYPGGVAQAVSQGAIIGAHVNQHYPLDYTDYAGSRSRLQATKQLIAQHTGINPNYFVAPGYFAVLSSTLQAIIDEGFITTGEQAFSPFPHFTLNMGTNTEMGSLLQLPVTGALDQIPDWTEESGHVRINEQLGGLLNLYDHAGECLPNWMGADEAERILAYALRNAPEVWSTTSGEIRDWWLERERHLFAASSATVGSRRVITATMTIASPRAATPFSGHPTALRIELDPAAVTLANQRTAVLLGGVPSSDYFRRGSTLYVRVGNATSVSVELGL